MDFCRSLYSLSTKACPVTGRPQLPGARTSTRTASTASLCQVLGSAWFTRGPTSGASVAGMGSATGVIQFDDLVGTNHLWARLITIFEGEGSGQWFGGKT